MSGTGGYSYTPLLEQIAATFGSDDLSRVFSALATTTANNSVELTAGAKYLIQSDGDDHYVLLYSAAHGSYAGTLSEQGYLVPQGIEKSIIVRAGFTHLIAACRSGSGQIKYRRYR